MSELPELDLKLARTPASLWRALHRIFGLSRPYRKRLYLAVGLTIIGTVIWLVVPLGIRSLLDAVFEAGNRRLLNLLALALVGLFLIRACVGFLGNYLLEWTGERVVTDLRKRVYGHLYSLTLGFFSNQRIGDLTSRLTNDVGSVRTAVTTALVDVLTQTLTLLGSIALMTALNWRLSLLVFLVVPPVALMSRFFGAKIRKLARQVQDRLADATAVAEEAMSAIRVVKAFAREPYELDRYETSVEALFETARYRIWIASIFWSIVGLTFMGVLVSIFWFGGTEVLAGRLTAGDLVAFIIYTANVARTVGGLSRLYTTFNTAAGASERLFELLDTVPEIQDAPDATVLPRLEGAVVFDHVTFGYTPDVPVLHDLNLAVAPGETVALVGPSGVGKTTLLNLIPRFYDPLEGRVLVDGHDLRQVDRASLRQQIAVVAQDVHLFNTSIRENIRYGRLDATDAEVEAAAAAANAHVFVDEMEQGYDTAVGERGVKLSGGQRQRIAIARALLKDARILLLDEATSSLDSASEALVQAALERLMEGRTTFIIAHRLSTVQHVDRIIVLEAGRIVQVGTHAQLMADSGLYRELASLQFREATL